MNALRPHILAALLLTGCGSPTEGFGPLQRFADALAGACDYEGSYTLTLTPVDPACGEHRVVHDNGSEVGVCNWSINGQSGHVSCDGDEHPVEQCDGETRDDAGCWYLVDYSRQEGK